MNFQILEEQQFKTLEDFQQISQKILSEIYQKPDLLRQLILNLKKDQRLLGLCEHYDILDKLVLYTTQDEKVRLRMHIFAEGYFDRPHNHRWSYSSCILTGGYRHTIFKLDEASSAPTSEDLVPILIRDEKKGDIYTLHRSQYHSVLAYANTVTLILRGPSEQDRFRVLDRVTNESWWQFGASIESEEEKNKKRMTPERLDAAFAKLAGLGII